MVGSVVRNHNKLDVRISPVTTITFYRDNVPEVEEDRSRQSGGSGAVLTRALAPQAQESKSRSFARTRIGVPRPSSE